jgi:hypothetical protein
MPLWSFSSSLIRVGMDSEQPSQGCYVFSLFWLYTLNLNMAGTPTLPGKSNISAWHIHWDAAIVQQVTLK